MRVKITYFTCPYCKHTWTPGGISGWDGRCPCPSCQALLSGGTCSHCGLPMSQKDLSNGYCPHCRTFQAGECSPQFPLTKPTPVEPCKRCQLGIPASFTWCPFCGTCNPLQLIASLVLLAFPWLALYCIDTFCAPCQLTTGLHWIAVVLCVLSVGGLISLFVQSMNPTRLPRPRTATQPTLPALVPGSVDWQLKRHEILMGRDQGTTLEQAAPVGSR
jgi:hypothetical protein